jgi:hypothetical protein
MNMFAQKQLKMETDNSGSSKAGAPPSEEEHELKWPSGTVLLVTDITRKFCTEFIVESRGRDCITLARPAAPYHRLVISQNNKIGFKESNDKSCFIRPVGDGNDTGAMVGLKSSFRELYLGFSESGDLETKASPTFHFISVIPRYYDRKLPSLAQCQQQQRSQDAEANFLRLSSRTSPRDHTAWADPSQPDQRRTLSRSQLQQLYHYGYVHISSLVEPRKIEDCVKLLNHYLGVAGSIVRGGVQGNDFGKFEGGITRRPEVLSLIEGSLTEIIENSLLAGAGCIDKTTSNLQAQIAYRFPELHSPYEYMGLQPSSPGPVSGSDAVTGLDLSTVPWHTDGLRQGRAHGFTILVGICLADTDRLLAGNLLIWPRTHKLLHVCKTNEYGALDMESLDMFLSGGFDCRAMLTDDEKQAIFDEDQAERMHHGRTISRKNSNTIISRTTSLNQSDHENEPTNLPSLGNPISLIMKAGVNGILYITCRRY